MTKKAIIPILTFVFIFFLSLQVVTDTDFGWHSRVGEYVYQTKSIPRHDLFSFSQSNYPYVYHSWATALLLFFSYWLFGLTGVTILYAAILTIGLFFSYQAAKILSKNQISHLFFLWASALAYAVAGGRTRIFGFLFLSLLYFLFLKFSYHQSKMVWAIPAIFFLWVNFHGSFILGLAVLVILSGTSWLFAENKISQWRKVKPLLMIIPLSFLATFINPYFDRAWQQAIVMSINSYQNLSNINLDWQPLTSLTTGGWTFALIALALILTIFFVKTSVANSQKFILLLFFFLSLFTARFALALLVFFVPTVNQLLWEFKRKLNDQVLNSPPVRIAIFSLLAILFLTVISNLIEIKYAYSSPGNYSNFLANISFTKFLYSSWPYQANLFIDKNLKNKRILNESNWGGFLLLHDPTIKIFYYGAMDNFLVNGRSFAFEYLDLVRVAPGWEEKLEKYQIEAVLLPPSFPLVTVLKLKPNWQIVYQDKQAVILVKI